MGQNEREGGRGLSAGRPTAACVCLSVFGPYLAMEMGRTGWQSISLSRFPMVLARLDRSQNLIGRLHPINASRHVYCTL